MRRSLVVLGLVAAGCAPRPPVVPEAAGACRPEDQRPSGCLVDGVDVIGADRIKDDEVRDSIVTGGRARGGLPGVWDRLVGRGERFNPMVLETDLERVERLYREHGFYEAHVRAGRVRFLSSGKVRVEIVVDEGQPVNVDRVDVDYVDGAVDPPLRVRAAVAAAAGLAQPGAPVSDESRIIGAPIEEKAVTEAKAKILRILLDEGYAYATVEARVLVDAPKAHVRYAVTLGAACTFGPVEIVGAAPFPRDRVLEAIPIEIGGPYSQARIDEAIAALYKLGIFDAVEVERGARRPPPGEPRPTVLPTVFHVTPRKLRSFTWDVGAEAGSRVEGHVGGGFEHRNVFGQLGRFSLAAKVGVVIYPWSLETTSSAGPAKALPELRLRADLVQPISLKSPTNAVAGIAGSMYELLPGDLLGYYEVVGRVGVERDLWASRLHLELLGNLRYDQPFLYPSFGSPLSAASGYGPVTVPFLRLGAAFDLRSNGEGKPDAVNPHQGVYLAADTQVAGHDSEDVRARGEARGYIPLAKHWTLATRLVGGILYAFGGPLAKGSGSGVPTGTCTSALVATHLLNDDNCARFLQLLQLRGFQSGGSDSNRGYPYGGVGPHEPVPIPSQSPLPWSAIQGGKLSSTGGSALWEASVELRFRVAGSFGGAFFVDGSDLWRADQPHTIAPHLSTGFSPSYSTPIGLLRADIGLRIPGAQELGVSWRCPVYDPTAAGGGPHTCSPGKSLEAGGNYLSAQYGQASSAFGLPLALALAIGEAF